VGRAKTLFLVTRPWSFTFTVMVVLIASIVPLVLGEGVSWALVGLALVGSVLLHAMVNVLNDYFDYSLGLDRPGVGTVEYRPHPIVHGILTPQATLAYGLSVGLAGLALAGVAVALGRPLALLLGGLGALLAYAYSGRPFYMKYRGLGEVGVYLAWGVLIPLGSYYLATGKLSAAPILALLPLAVGIVGVLMANNVRDLESDREAGVKTLQVRLGPEASRRLFKATVYAVYATGFAAAAVNPLLAIPPALGLLTLPQARRVASMFDHGQAPPDADPRVAALLQKYSILYLIGLAAAIILARLAP
jgi:1,4-dihydroxy-2-naphthoate octaprenyltransferase